MSKQTSVEWLVEQLPIRILNMYHKEIEQAKEMEKEQIKDAYKFGIADEYVIGADRYYKETYNIISKK
jgi:hypothetical protein